MDPTSEERKLTNLQNDHDRIVSKLRVTEHKIIHLAHYAERLNRRLQSPLTCEEKDCMKAKLVHLSKRLTKFGANVKRLSAQCGADTQ